MRLTDGISAQLAPYVMLAGLVCVVGLFIGGYLLGQDDARTDCMADKAAALERLIAEQERLAEQDREILTTHETRAARVRTVFRSIRQEASRYALTHRDDPCGLDADGLRLWRAANAGQAPAAAEPDYRLPGAAAAGLGAAAGPAFQPHRDGGALSRMPGAASGAVGLGEK